MFFVILRPVFVIVCFFMANESHFGTVGAVLAAAGSAVGLGNIWRFPYMVGENGGAAFLLVYLLCVIFFGIPVMTAEFYAGRRGLKSWQWIRTLSFLSPTITLGFYFVVTGWCLHYLYSSCAGFPSGYAPEQLETFFSSFTGSLLYPLVWTAVAILLTAAVEMAGIKSGVERLSKILMPLLFLILTLLIGCGLMMPRSETGINFLFTPDFSKITPSLIVNAMGQCFLSLSIGMGILSTYAGFMKPEQNLFRTSLQVSMLDTLVAVLAGLAIFPAVFSLGIDPTQGPELVFVTLPSVFHRIRGGWWLQILFFLLLIIASITSTISLMQAQVSGLQHRFRLRRRWAIAAVSSIDLLLAVLCSLSLTSAGSALQVAGYSLFDLSDAFVSKVMFPLVGLLFAIYVGWKCPKADVIEQLSPAAGNFRMVGHVAYLIIRYMVPLVISLIILDSFGMLDRLAGMLG